MSNNSQLQKSGKPQIKMKLLRRIFYFIVALLMMPIVVFPLSRMIDGYSFKGISTDFYMLIVVTLALLILIAVGLFGVWPVISELLELRKKEKEEKEELGMFP